MLQVIVENKYNWDDPLTPDLQEECQAILKEMVEASKVEFPRCVVPKGIQTKTMMLLGFSDGGDPSSLGCIYVRTDRKELGGRGETHEVRFSLGAVTLNLC